MDFVGAVFEGTCSEGLATVRLLATLLEEEVRVSLKLLIWFSRKDILMKPILFVTSTRFQTVVRKE